MSHQTGIQANQELKSFFSKCKDGSVRVFKINIKNEELALDKYWPPKRSWEDDYDGYVLTLVERQLPCYLFYRLDSQNESGFEWIFICWSPDSAPNLTMIDRLQKYGTSIAYYIEKSIFKKVRDKMLFASTKATLKKEFGGGQIKHELFGTQKDEICLNSYKRNKDSDKQPLPLSNAEEILKQIKENEARTDAGLDPMKPSIQGVTFPISLEAINALKEVKAGSISYVQLSIDLENEKIDLVSKLNVDVHSLMPLIPTENARYHLFKFPHSYEGDYLESIVFIYSMPGYNCSIKERMLYSSCKASLLHVIEISIGIDIAKKIEIDEPTELTEEFLIDELHPKQNIHKQKFAKPKGPMNRGARRLLKTQMDNE